MITEVIKKWGKEQWIINSELYCAKLMTVLPGHSCSFHFHKDKTETFYILEGELDIVVKDLKTGKSTKKILRPGEDITIRPLQAHLFKTGSSYKCVFMEVSTYHKDSDTYRITESR